MEARQCYKSMEREMRCPHLVMCIARASFCWRCSRGKDLLIACLLKVLTLHDFAKMALLEPLESIFDLIILLPRGQMGEASTSISSVENQSSLSCHKIRECLISLLEVGIACSEEKPTDRLDMNEVVARLHKIKNTLLESGVRGVRSSRIAVSS